MITLLQVQEAAQQTAEAFQQLGDVQPEPSFWAKNGFIIMMGLMILAMWFFMWRPESKRRKQMQEFRNGLKKRRQDHHRRRYLRHGEGDQGDLAADRGRRQRHAAHRQEHGRSRQLRPAAAIALGRPCHAAPHPTTGCGAAAFSAEAPAAEHARPDSRASANPGPQTRAPRPLPARPYAAPRPDRPPPAPEQRPHGAAPSLVNTPSRRSRTSAVPAARRLAEASDPPHPRRTPPQPVPPRHLPCRIRTPHRRRSRTLARSPPASSVTAGRTAAKSHPLALTGIAQPDARSFIDC